MKTISAIASSPMLMDRSFKAISALSCLGMALSLGLMVYGMDLNAVWF
jgi:hypothetical protein